MPALYTFTNYSNSEIQVDILGAAQRRFKKSYIRMVVSEPNLTIYIHNAERSKLTFTQVYDYSNCSPLLASAADLKILLESWGAGGGGILTVAVDGVTVFGDGVAVPLSAPGSGGGYTIVNVSTSPYAVVPVTGHTIYQVDCTLANIVITLPSAVGNTAMYSFKKIDSSGRTIQVKAAGGETIDGATDVTIKFQNTSLDVYSDNVVMFIK
jgi:hypothetical protein